MNGRKTIKGLEEKERKPLFLGFRNGRIIDDNKERM